MPPTFESNHEANKFTARLLLHHFLSKENMEWLAQYAEFGLVNEQKLALVFVREVGAIDNATYRQLDSSITHARARLEIHKLCDLGFLEKKGQGQQRSCALALKIAEGFIIKDYSGEKPVALLDDVLSELDSKRQVDLIKYLDGWQVFITCCDKAHVSKIDYGKAFEIKSGTLSVM